jgi:hypothetical protein
LSADEPQELEADAPELKADAEPAEPEVESDDDGEEGDEPSLSLTDLAKYLGVEESALDIDENGALNLKTKVDGQEGKAKLNDLLTSYQLRSHLDNQTRAQAEQQKAWQAQVQQAEQVIQARVQQVETMANAAQEQLTRDFNGIDWQLLRQTDPAEYAASLQDFQARQAQINQIAQTAAYERQHFSAQQQQQTAEQLMAEAEALPKVIPEWSNAEVAAREKNEIKQWALNNGIPQAEVDSVSRSAHVALMRKAMLYDRMQSSKAAVEHKVRTAPRLVKPGQSQPTSNEESSLRNIKTQIQKSGGKQGITEYLLASGKV